MFAQVLHVHSTAGVASPCGTAKASFKGPMAPLSRSRAPSVRQLGRGWPGQANASQVENQGPNATQTIEDLDTNYCDDFECTSSPAVEQTVRSFANDILACRANPAFCQPDYKFSDGIRSFEGRDKLLRANHPWYKQLSKPKVSISKMQMLDKGTAKLNWRMAGGLGPMPVDIQGTSVIEMNLLTGRIFNHREELDLSACSPPASMAVNASRLSWAVQQAALDTKEKIDEKMPKMESDDNSGGTFQDPTDPTKFFQTNQPDKGFEEAVTLATVAAVIWLIFKTYAELEKLP